MARPVVIDDDLLLSTAREVFLEKGLRATTAEISARAGVSQGILFKRFKTKQALFRAAMNIEDDPGSPLPIDLKDRVGKGTVQKNLNDLGNLLVNRYFSIIPTLMMDWSNTREENTSADQGGMCAQGPEKAVKGMRAIATYLGDEAKLGRLRKANFEILAQMFAGACWHYVFLQVMMGEVHQEPLTQEQYVKNVVQNLWSGIAPSTTQKKEPSQR